MPKPTQYRLEHEPSLVDQQWVLKRDDGSLVAFFRESELPLADNILRELNEAHPFPSEIIAAQQLPELPENLAVISRRDFELLRSLPASDSIEVMRYPSDDDALAGAYNGLTEKGDGLAYDWEDDPNLPYRIARTEAGDVLVATLAFLFAAKDGDAT